MLGVGDKLKDHGRKLLVMPPLKKMVACRGGSFSLLGWNVCDSLGKNMGRFKEETWNGQPCIHLTWTGRFPDGVDMPLFNHPEGGCDTGVNVNEQGTKEYGAAYFYKGTGSYCFSCA